MISRPLSSRVRAIRLASITIGIVVGSIWFSKPSYSQPAAPAGSTPTVVAAPATPTVAAAPGKTQDTQPATPASAASDTPAGSPTSGPQPDPTADARRRQCERYVAVLAGRSQDHALLGNRDFQGLPIGTSDLVMCGAVLTDSDALCKRMMPVEHGPSMACRKTWAAFHELRAYPNKRTFMLDEIDWQECRGVPALTKFCDSLRQALRSGDPKDCAQTGDGESICLAYMKLDKSLCHVTGKLAEVEFALPDRKPGEPAKIKVKDVADESCRQKIDERTFLAKGLKELAESGPPREREFAKAALGQADACASFVQPAVELCVNAGTAAPGKGAPIRSPGVKSAPKKAAEKASPPVKVKPIPD